MLSFGRRREPPLRAFGRFAAGIQIVSRKHCDRL